MVLIVAISLETVGDAIVRIGIGQSAGPQRSALFPVGVVLPFYGFSLNRAPIEFSCVVGLYIETPFFVWQIVNVIVFPSPPVTPVWFGGALIVLGGLIVTFCDWAIENAAASL